MSPSACSRSTDDVREMVLPVLRHRLIPTFNAEAAGIDVDQIVTRLVEEIDREMSVEEKAVRVATA